MPPLIDAFIDSRREEQWATDGVTLRHVGTILLVVAIASSSLTFQWVVYHRPETNFYPEFAGITVYLSDVFLVLGLIIWATGWYLSPTLRVHTGPTYLEVPLLVILVLSVIGVFWADDKIVTGHTALRRLLLLGLYIVLATEARRAAVPLVIAMGLVAIAHASVNLLQLSMGHAVGLSALGEIQQESQGYNTIGSPQAFGLGFNPNPVALHLAATSVLAYSFYLLYPGGRFIRTLTLLVFLATLVGTLATLSRSAPMGWIIGAVTLSVLALIGARIGRALVARRIGIAVIAVAAVAVIGIAASQIVGGPKSAFEFRRFAKDEVTRGIGIRIADYNLSRPIIEENFILGVGAGNYPQKLTESQPADARTTATTPVHNVVLVSLAELGLIGAIAWLAIVASPLVWFARGPGSRRFDTNSIIWLAPLIVLLFESFLDFTPLSTQDGRVLMWGLLGMWAGTVVAAQEDAGGLEDPTIRGAASSPSTTD